MEERNGENRKVIVGHVGSGVTKLISEFLKSEEFLCTVDSKETLKKRTEKLFGSERK